MTARPRLGFIGIGIMGEAMTLRLLDRRWPVTVWNLTEDRYAKVVPAGARVAASPADVAAASDLVLMCVLDAPAVRNCVFGENGLASARQGARLLIDHSTINPDVTREVAGALASATGMGWIDAPVSGGPLFARDGRLTIMAGGSEAGVASALPAMQDLAATFTHVGPLGAGQTAKILNQAIVGTGYVLMAEALALAEAAGLDAAKLPQCLAGGFADSMLLQKIYPQMCARDFDPPRAYARQLLKDLKNVKGFAHDAGCALPLIETAVAQYGAYVAAGNEMADAASVSRLYEQRP
ncbi:MAG TPA: NAD(P)-dependent oxidoreductase [Stellaceae bacterium]|nr:NAD(P)-dependent oxidoreductase [Stellaceae bacterium]